MVLITPRGPAIQGYKLPRTRASWGLSLLDRGSKGFRGNRDNKSGTGTRDNKVARVLGAFRGNTGDRCTRGSQQQ